MHTENFQRFFIGGEWVAPVEGRPVDVIDPSTEEPFARILVGDARDVDRAVAAATAALPGYMETTREQRLEWLRRTLAALKARRGDMAQTLSREMGSPLQAALDVQVGLCLTHFETMIEVLGRFEFETRVGDALVVREAIGVCGLITPWNAPLNQIACKVAPALAAGCTIVLKPSEVAPLNAVLFAEAIEEAGLPPGVFNLVQGDGPGVGAAMSTHPGIAMVSFTGSSRAGVQIAQSAAATVKRVHQELGGKSANIVLPDADLERAVALGVAGAFRNSGQSCSAPTRMLVPGHSMDRVIEIAREAAATFRVGSPFSEDANLGPLVSRAQFETVQRMIQSGLDEGATLVAGGPGRPDGLARGYFARPTVFAHVRPEMTIAQEEIFGPVLSIIGYRDEDDAIAIANGTRYGLAAYVQSASLDNARRVARRMQAGVVHLNYPPFNPYVPFGGYKQSGNGKEFGEYGLAEFLETKAITGYA